MSHKPLHQESNDLLQLYNNKRKAFDEGSSVDSGGIGNGIGAEFTNVEGGDSVNSNKKKRTNDVGSSDAIKTTTSDASTAISTNKLLQRKQEHDQRLVQILQYIATMNTTISTTTGTSDIKDPDSSTTSSTTVLHQRKKMQVPLEKVATHTDPSLATSTSSMFIKKIPEIGNQRVDDATVSNYIPPYFYYRDVLKEQQHNSLSAPPDRIISSSSITTTKNVQEQSYLMEQNNRNILFTTDTFRYLYQYYGSNKISGNAGVGQTRQLNSKLPFSFYGASSPSTTKASTSSMKAISDPVCWLRLTRLSSSSTVRDIDAKASTTTSSFKSIDMKQRQAASLYEPIYNRLFEYIQQRQQNDNEHSELLWGFGNGSLIIPPSVTSSATTIVSGPLLEVPVEVELGSKDGAIYVRPKQAVVGNTSTRSGGGGGIRINRDVLVALLRHSASQQTNSTSSGTSIDTMIQSWFRKVIQQQNVDILAQLSPAQPDTYNTILQQMTMELFSTGIYLPSDTQQQKQNFRDNINRVVISDVWCLYLSNKPYSILSRDALSFASHIQNSQSSPQLELSNEMLPPATWAITHGPGSYERFQKEVEEELKRNQENYFMQFIRSVFCGQDQKNGNNFTLNTKKTSKLPPKISLPLASTDVHHRIVDMLLYQNYPCVVVEGPPGTGKSQTICNLICAYLRVGKRVLVTSKYASSLSVIRKRLPQKSIQELCIDVSNSESNGVRQLQQTVERLSNRLANSNYHKQQQSKYNTSSSSSSSFVNVESVVDMEQEKLQAIQKSIDEHENELKSIDEAISKHSRRIYEIVQSEDGQLYISIAMELLDRVPWLMSTLSKWTALDVSKFLRRIEPFVLQSPNGVIVEEGTVRGYLNPPSTDLISLASCYANIQFHAASFAIRKTVSRLPILGPWIGMDQYTMNLEREISNIRIGDRIPTKPDEWMTVVRALRRARALHKFGQDEWATYERQYLWPEALPFLFNNEILNDFCNDLRKALQMKNLEWKLNVGDVKAMSLHCQSLHTKRCALTDRIRVLSEELVNLTVLTELCSSLSEEALSSLIRFSQIAGKSKFHKPTTALTKMSLRQRRHRQEYLDAFDRCCRYIPCWILTTSQISDYLPPECLFDLVIIDETSQSDITVLPTMLRGKQWLIVGDGKQVSPTESFISEEQMEHLRTTIPECYFESSLLPGQSFFDLCSQAFPTSRVVLNEHFRCASEIIAFSNDQFYDNQLIPLRLPSPSERILPSIVDVFIPNGVKVGKINESEANEIVHRVKEIVQNQAGLQRSRRSIGIISLMGDEQSRLIRGRLLDAIGPLSMAQHSILVGDPPSFQGTERDIIFLSMVCSKGRTPTQSQLVHFQRANVALSRARDQCILIRSLQISDIPSTDDVKVPIIEFFQSSSAIDTDEALCGGVNDQLTNTQTLLRRLLVSRLRAKGYKLCSMGVVWKDGICVEHPESDARVAISIDDIAATYQDWYSSYRQQQKIEGVGWKCLRVDILSFLSDCDGMMQYIREFLKEAGISFDDARSSNTNETVGDEAGNNDEKCEDTTSKLDEWTSSSHLQVQDELRVALKRTLPERKPALDRKSKKLRSVRHQNIRYVESSDDEIGEEGSESLVSKGSSHTSDGNVVVDLSFLRGK